MTKEQLEIELGRAYRCIEGMQNAMRTLPPSSFPFAYHSLTIGAAKRFVYQGALDGSDYFINKPVDELHAALGLPGEMK